MAQAKRDGNSVTNGMGVSDADNTTPLNLLVDAVTGRLLVVMTAVLDGTPTLSTAIKRDANSVTTAYGVSAADNTTLTPLHIDSRNDLLAVTVEAV